MDVRSLLRSMKLGGGDLMNVESASAQRIFESEREEIVGFCNRLHDDAARYESGDSRKWSKFKGNGTAQKVKSLLNRHVEKHNARVVGPNVFLKGLPTEIDLMVVDASAKLEEFTSACNPRDVKAIIEIKMNGFFSKDSMKSFVSYRVFPKA